MEKTLFKIKEILNKLLRNGIEEDFNNQSLIHTLKIFNGLSVFAGTLYFLLVLYFLFFKGFTPQKIPLQMFLVVYFNMFYIIRGNNNKINYLYYSTLYLIPSLLIINFHYLTKVVGESPLAAYFIFYLGLIGFFALVNLFATFNPKKKYNVLVFVCFLYVIVFEITVYFADLQFVSSSFSENDVSKVRILIKVVYTLLFIIILLYRYHSVRKETILVTNNEIIELRNSELEEQKRIVYEQAEDLKQKNNQLQLLLLKVNSSNDKLESIINAKDQFISMLSRDIRNQLTGSLLSLELIVKYSESMSAEESKKFIFNIYNDIEFLNESLNDILIWSKNTMGQVEVFPQYFYLSSLIDRAINELDIKIKNKNLRIQREFHSTYNTYADEQMLLSTFRNLISNAIKYSYKDSTIDIKLYENEDSEVLEIINYGIGLSKENFNTIYRTDTRYTSLGTNGEKGTGIGLKLCKFFLEKNNGRLEFDSEENSFTSFKVILSKNQH
jgi:signal transduction histidine kinase